MEVAVRRMLGLRAIAAAVVHLAALAGVGTVARADTIVVDAAGAGDFSEIQAALDAARDGDTVLVRPGEYTIREPIDLNRLHDPEDAWSPPLKDLIVRSEAGPAATTIRMADDPVDPDRASVVAFEKGETEASVLEGFLLAGGRGSLPSTEPGDPERPVGGGAMIVGSSPVLRDCRIAGNEAWAGGGVYCGWDSSPLLDGCSISRNRADTGAGVACLHAVAPRLERCRVTANAAVWEGGGILASRTQDLLLDGCLVAGNEASEGGGLDGWESPVRLVRCTVAGNVASRCGGIRWLRSARSEVATSLTGCIVWDNAGGSAYLPWAATVERSCVEAPAVLPGDGNILADPLFCGWEARGEVEVRSPGDLETLREGFRYSLAPGSPCRGTGLDGANMGADQGTCEGPPGPSLTLRLDPGAYPADDFPLAHHVSVQGSGEAVCSIEGTLSGLRSGAFLANLTVTGTGAVGIRVGLGESPEIREVTVSGGSDPGTSGVSVSALASPRLRGCTIVGSAGFGVVCEEVSAPLFDGCTIRGSALGGVSCPMGSLAAFVDCTIAGNLGVGVSVFNGSVSMTRSTIADNVGGGEPGGIVAISSYGPPSVTLTSCIVWGNVGGSLGREIDGAAAVETSFSCLAGVASLPGEGNIDEDPRLCGWAPLPAEVAVRDPENLERLRGAFGYGLAASSPCRGAGKDGEDMGAPHGTCGDEPRSSIRVRLEPGRYRLEGRDLLYRISVEGTRAEDCIVEGPVLGLRGGCELANVTVTGSDRAGIVVAEGEAVRIRGCAIVGNAGDGVVALGGQALEDCAVSSNGGLGVDAGPGTELVRCRIAGNSAGVRCSQGSVLTDCTVSGNGLARPDGAFGVACEASSSASLSGCTISGNSGGGIVCEVESRPVLTRCRIVGNLDSGVILEGASPTLVRCTIAGNSSVAKGAGFRSRAVPEIGGFFPTSLTLRSCIVWDNAGGSFGLDPDARTSVSHCAIEGAGPVGGAGNLGLDPRFRGWDSTPEVDVRTSAELRAVLGGYRYALSEASPCLGAGEDGADMGADLGEAGPDGPPELLVRLAPGTYDLGGLTLAHRVSLQGAGRSASTVRGTVHGLRTGATLAGVTVTGGVESGIRIPAGEAPSVVSATIEGNRATDGGGLLIGTDAAPLVARCRIARNWAWEHGGGVDCRGPAALVRCEISENFSPQGGGIASSAADTVSACRIAGNQAASGGGLWLRGSSRVSGCVISGNLAGQGGGLAVLPGAAPVVVGCEISGNCAIATSAVYLSSDATVEVRSSTIAGNEGAGIWCVARAVATMESSIVWGNLWGPIARDDATVRVSYSCLEGPESASGPGNVALDPRFARAGAFDFSRFVVAEIGGIEQEMPDFVVEEPDYRLLDDSPCLDSGRPRGAGTDLDGNRRPCGAGLDMGAYERGDCRPGPRFVRGDANADGRRDLSDAVSSLTWLFLGGAEPPCLDAADVDDQAGVSITDPVLLLNHLFLSGASPPEPAEACGTDPTADDLGCASFPPCG